MKTKIPPLGVITKLRWNELNPVPSRREYIRRIADLQRACAEYKSARLTIPKEWTEELAEKIELITAERHKN